MLPNILTDTFKPYQNHTSLHGEIVNRNILYRTQTGSLTIIEGQVDGQTVIETHTVDTFGSSQRIETLNQYKKRIGEFNKVCQSLV